MARLVVPIGLVGLLLATCLVVYIGLPAVLEAVASSGWAFLAVSAYHGISLLCAAMAWRALLVRRHTLPRSLYLAARTAREAVNNLLPVAQIGGEIVAARLVILKGLSSQIAAASVIVDLTVETGMQVLFTLIGLGLLLLFGIGGGLIATLVIGVATGAALIGGFVLAQRFGMFRLAERLMGRLASDPRWASLGALTGLHDAMMALYRDWRGVLSACAWHLSGWVLGAGEVWIALHMMGIPIGVGEAIALESVVHAVRSAAFFVPMALGVQEGAFLLAGSLFGIGPEAAVAVSLIKRVRDLLLGAPVLLIWQVTEGRRAITRLWRNEKADEV